MDVVIAGGHGQIALRLTELLAARADRVRGLIRNPDHADDLRANGGEPVLCDLETAAIEDVATAIGRRRRCRLRRRRRRRQRRRAQADGRP